MTVTITSVLPTLDAGAVASLAGPVRDALAAAAEGNGLQGRQVRVAREETVTHRLPAEISVTFSHKLQQEPRDHIPANGTAVADEAAARAAAQSFEATLSSSAHLAEIIDRELRKQPGQGFGISDLRFSLGPHGEKVFYVANADGTAQVFIAKSYATATFILWRQGNDEKALLAVEKLGLTALADTDIADVFIMPLSPDGARLKSPCVVFVAVSHIEFSLEGRFVTATAAGKHGKVVEMDPILDKFLKPGIAALLKLSRGPMAVEPLVGTAMKFRLVRQALQGLTYKSRSEMYRQLAHDYPLGVSDKYLKATIKYAGLALPALTTPGRRQGFWLGLGLTAAAALLFYTLDLRRSAVIMTTYNETLSYVWLDVAAWAVLCAAGVLFIRLRARTALARAVQAASKPRDLPPAGRIAWLLAGGNALIFFVTALTAPANRPAWAEALVKTVVGLTRDMLPFLFS